MANLPSGITLTNPCAIQLGAGLFTESSLLFKPNVAIIGISYRATRLTVTSGFIGIDLSSGYVGNCRNSIFGLSLSGSTGLTFDTTSLPFSSFVFDMGEAWVNGNLTFTGRPGGADYCQLYRGYLFGNLILTNVQGEANDLTIVGNASVTCSAMTGTDPTEYDFPGSRIGGTLTYTSDGSRNQLGQLTNASILSGVLSASGTGTVITGDVTSLPPTSGITLTGGASLVRMTPSANRVAVPATSSSAGMVGDYAVDSTHAYFCISTNTWVRATVATW
jgi:hypothetical protein